MAGEDRIEEAERFAGLRIGPVEGRGQIVGEAEADIENNLLNIRSPLARALIGKDEGDSVEVRTPGGDRSYEVLSVEYR